MSPEQCLSSFDLWTFNEGTLIQLRVEREWWVEGVNNWMESYCWTSISHIPNICDKKLNSVDKIVAFASWGNGSGIPNIFECNYRTKRPTSYFNRPQNYTNYQFTTTTETNSLHERQNLVFDMHSRELITSSNCRCWPFREALELMCDCVIVHFTFLHNNSNPLSLTALCLNLQNTIEAVKMSIEIKNGQKAVEYPAECCVAYSCGPPKVPTGKKIEEGGKGSLQPHILAYVYWWTCQ